MTRKQKNAWMWYILSNDRQNIFNFNLEFHRLDYWDTQRLERYAEVFGIRESGGKSKARKLWDRVTNELPF